MPNAAAGTLTVRRRFVNTTGAPVTRLRFRIVDFSSLTLPPIADVRALDSVTVTVNGVNDAAHLRGDRYAGHGALFGAGVWHHTEQPPAQALGGALNSSLECGSNNDADTVGSGSRALTCSSGSVCSRRGNFKFFFNVEALP